jgi:hypothetical protein
MEKRARMREEQQEGNKENQLVVLSSSTRDMDE